MQRERDCCVWRQKTSGPEPRGPPTFQAGKEEGLAGTTGRTAGEVREKGRKRVGLESQGGRRSEKERLLNCEN